MKSVIINMVDRMKDAEDLKLEALFASEPIVDAGFSAGIEKRLRRQVWVRRLSLPIAVIVGGLIAVKPLAGLLTSVIGLLSVVPASIGENIAAAPGGDLPQLSTILLGAMLAVGAVLMSRIIED